MIHSRQAGRQAGGRWKGLCCGAPQNRTNLDGGGAVEHGVNPPPASAAADDDVHGAAALRASWPKFVAVLDRLPRFGKRTSLCCLGNEWSPIRFCIATSRIWIGKSFALEHYFVALSKKSPCIALLLLLLLRARCRGRVWSCGSQENARGRRLRGEKNRLFAPRATTQRGGWAVIYPNGSVDAQNT